MHEFPEVQQLVRDALTRVPQSKRIRRLVIAIGEASGITPEGIEHHFPAAARGTPAENAVLEFQREKLAARCAHCAAEFKPQGMALACPQCGSTELTITGGQGVRLADIEIGS
ncbi:MAG: hydrogenase maturation nickel metallochaperone HypA [Candidatus Omnitrophica bacterium]|nr:hydrogenase maturation nickel metallochaperone HypA [Candidatus Omnitrophota bacterium]